MEQQEKKGPNVWVKGVEGITLGISAAIPGLSAGTIAIAERCYEPLVDAVSGLRGHFKKSFLYLLPYLLGLILGAVAALIGIQKGYEAAPFTLTGLFAGFVFGSLPVTFEELHHGKTGKEVFFHVLSFVLCLLVAAGLGIVTALTKVDLSSSLASRVWWMYPLALVSGIVAAAACVVPGISGSMSLMVIGMYFPILNSFATRSGDLSIWNHDGANYSGSFVGTGIVIALLLVIGAIIGLILSSRVMKSLLEKHRTSTYFGILGLILGSLVSMFINSNIYPKYPTIKTWDYVVGSILFVLGAIGVYLLIRFSNKQKEKSATKKED